MRPSPTSFSSREPGPQPTYLCRDRVPHRRSPPPASRKYHSYWSGNTGGAARAIKRAGWKVVHLDMKREDLVFVPIGDQSIQDRASQGRGRQGAGLDHAGRAAPTPRLSSATRRRSSLRSERCGAGPKGEGEAAYEIEFYYGATDNHMTLHDLRLEVGGRVAQIDHVIVNRLLHVWVCESKHFSEGVAVDEFGEWTGFSHRRPFGIGSPIEQNRKHIAVLNDVFRKRLVAPPKRLGFTLRPECEGPRLVSKRPGSAGRRTKAVRDAVDGLASVIKVDQIRTVLNRAIDSAGTSRDRRFIGKGELERFARELAALHRPIQMDWAARFGLPAHEASGRGARCPREPEPRPRACEACSATVSAAVVAFCADRAEVFGGRVLCMPCQRKARKGLA